MVIWLLDLRKNVPLAKHRFLCYYVTMKKILFLDMDGVLADFDGSIVNHIEDPPEMFVPGFFRNLAVMPGAKEAVTRIMADERFDVYIGSKVTSKATNCATEKMEWIAEHFPSLLKRMMLVCDKRLLRGDILIDDDLERWGHVFNGKFIHFDRKNSAESWKWVIEYLGV